MKRGTGNHPKVDRVMRSLNCNRTSAVGILVMLWQTTQEFAPRGDIGKYSDREISNKMGYTTNLEELDLIVEDVSIDERQHAADKRAADLITALTEAGWLDPIEPGRLYVHDWHDHCEDSVHARLARATQTFANGALPKLSMLPKDERVDIADAFERAGAGQPTQLTIATTRTSVPYKRKAPTHAELDQTFEQFWSAWPDKQNKARARQAWAKIQPSMAMTREIVAAVIAQKDGAQLDPTYKGGQFIPLATTWLNGQRWEDALKFNPGRTKPAEADPPPPEITDDILRTAEGA